MTDRAPRAGSPIRALGLAAVVFASFSLLLFGVYRGALTGPFVSDDLFLIVTNPYLLRPPPELLRESFAPLGDVSKVTMILLMWVGRLEIVPVVVLLTRNYWRR